MINIIWLLVTLVISISWRLSEVSYRQYMEEKEHIIYILIENNESLLESNKRLLIINKSLLNESDLKDDKN